MDGDSPKATFPLLPARRHRTARWPTDATSGRSAAVQSDDRREPAPLDQRRVPPLQPGRLLQRSPVADPHDGRQLPADRAGNASATFLKAPDFSAADYYDRCRARTYACCFGLENADHLWLWYGQGSLRGKVCVVFDFAKLRQHLNSGPRLGHKKDERTTCVTKGREPPKVRKLLLQLRSKLARLLLDSIRFARSDRIVPVAMELVRNQVQ